jgi:hypothetical protein
VRRRRVRREGLQADSVLPHRTSLLKFKQWLDAEYTVTDVQRAVMRLPVDQVYDDREVMASEWRNIPYETPAAHICSF